MPHFKHAGHRLEYTSYGEGPRTIVLLPGLLFSQRMHIPLARALAGRGNRVLTLDLLGHGASERPTGLWNYSMDTFGEQAVGLLDHLEIDEAVFGGTSLGANVALAVASGAPERMRGMMLEMPVLEAALIGCALAFTPLMVGLTFGAPVSRLIGRAARLIPRQGMPLWPDVVLDWIGQDPAPSAAVIEGLFFGRVAPHRDERRTFTAPTLVIGHHRDPIHPFADAGMLVDELPNARFIEANSFLEMRLAPERLTAEIADFLDDCWKPRRASRGGTKKRTAAAKRSGAG